MQFNGQKFNSLFGKLSFNPQLAVLLKLASWCLVIAVSPFLAVPWVCLQFVSVVFPDHTHLLSLFKNAKIGFLYEKWF